VTAAGAPPIDEALKRELTSLYRDGSRHYHGIEHIEALLALAEEYLPLLSDPQAVEAAIWFHDAIYDSQAKDNEERSADLAARRLSGKLEATRLDRIVTMIRATAKHELPRLESAAALRDAELFLDMDMSILGAAADIFDRYEAAVRKEYAWVPEAAWVTGRRAVLRSFLDRPFIYLSVEFRDRFETQARENIRRSLSALECTGP
jgi:predicted metal-dependent HD superfamily phosphohydrolase